MACIICRDHVQMAIFIYVTDRKQLYIGAIRACDFCSLAKGPIAVSQNYVKSSRASHKEILTIIVVHIRNRNLRRTGACRYGDGGRERAVAMTEEDLHNIGGGPNHRKGRHAVAVEV